LLEAIAAHAMALAIQIIGIRPNKKITPGESYPQRTLQRRITLRQHNEFSYWHDHSAYGMA
jgi:hypothetical protein